MKPIDFPEQNIIFRGTMENSCDMPAFRDENQVISCWDLTWRERLRLLLGKKIWLWIFAPVPPHTSIDTLSPFTPDEDKPQWWLKMHGHDEVKEK